MSITIVNSQQLSLVALDLEKRSPARIQIRVGESISRGPTIYCWTIGNAQIMREEVWYPVVNLLLSSPGSVA